MSDRRVIVNGRQIEPTEFIWSKHRKKPVIVSATRILAPFEVETLEGTMRGNPGDWLIKGVQGELYPCRDDIFRQTYEVAERISLYPIEPHGESNESCP